MATAVTITADMVVADETLKLHNNSMTDVVLSAAGISSPGSDGNLVSEKAIVEGIGTITGKVLVSSGDTTIGYLYDKLSASTGVSIAIINTGANEDVQITNTITKIIELLDVGFTAEPTSDKILYWDNTSTKWQQLAIGTNLTIAGGVLNAAGSGTAVDYRADTATLLANTATAITFSSSLGTVDADLMLDVGGIDFTGNKVVLALTLVTVAGFTVEASTACDITYMAFIKK